MSLPQNHEGEPTLDVSKNPRVGLPPFLCGVNHNQFQRKPRPLPPGVCQKSIQIERSPRVARDNPTYTSFSTTFLPLVGPSPGNSVGKRMCQY